MLKVESPIFLSAYKESEEIDAQKPFVIRGHHLREYASLISNRDTPSELAEHMRINIQNVLQSNPTGSPAEKYAQDIFETSAQADAFEDNSRVAFETFLNLPDNYPAEIVEGLPDVICAGCAIGKHCRRVINKGLLPENTLELDTMYVDSFLKGINSIKCYSKVSGIEQLIQTTTAYEQAHFSDAEPQHVRRIKTTFGTIKQVLKQTDSKVWSQ